MKQDSQPEIEGLIERLLSHALALEASSKWNDGEIIDAFREAAAALRELEARLDDREERLTATAKRWLAAEAKLSALLSLKEGGGLGSSSAEIGALLASQASCSATPSSTGKED